MGAVKLAEFSPTRIAAEVSLAARADLRRIASAVGAIAHTGMGEPPVFTAAYVVAEYALTGKLRARYEANRSRLIQWLGEPAVLQRFPETPLAAAVAVCEAREALEGRAPLLTSVQVGLLTGLDRDSVNDLARNGEIPDAFRSDETRHRPWRFKATKALRGWMADRPGAVAGL